MGNAAYEAGNISGGAMGADLLVNLPVLTLGQLEINVLNFCIGLLALVLLMSGSYSKITGFLTILVILMSLAFLASAVWVRPSFISILEGFVPVIDATNILTIVALIGTTVVPYNLFLHSSLVAKRWSTLADLKYVRADTVVAVILGGIVSMAIIITAASGKAIEVNNAADLALGLEPMMGALAKYFIAFGLFAAGITSAITAPLAGSLVVVDCFGLSNDINKMPMRISIICILGLGLLFSSLGIKPVQLITFAQLANGILLPLLSAYILWLVNKKAVMQTHVNSYLLNIIGLAIWLITLALGMMSIGKVLDWV
jgi:Mn2+/Fe2+ NRAMP family transporter